MKIVRAAPASVLFTYPIFLPAHTVYEELGLGPESSIEEIQWAVKKLNDGRLAERNSLRETVKTVLAQVPGLEAAYTELESICDDKSARSRAADLQAKIVALEKKAVAIFPEFFKTQEQAKLLEQKINELNQLGLVTSGTRRAYDEKHPPCALLKIVAASRDGFLDSPRTALWLLRREIVKFLGSKGEAVCHISDLDRDDFSSDFSWNSIIDG